jgi:hypothetical protein
MVLSYIFGVVLFQSLLLDVSSRTRTGAKCILLTVTIVVFFVLTLSVSGDRTRVELQKLLRPLGHLQGRSFRRSQATPARSELPQVTGNTCKVGASAGHGQHLQGRSFRRSQATPARSELPQVTGSTCKVAASAGHRQHLQGRSFHRHRQHLQGRSFRRSQATPARSENTEPVKKTVSALRQGLNSYIHCVL